MILGKLYRFCIVNLYIIVNEFLTTYLMCIFNMFVFLLKYVYFFRNIMMDVRRDNRVLFLVSKVGLRNFLIIMLDQFQRCQKFFNEFLEVCFCFKKIIQFYIVIFERFFFVKFLGFFVFQEKRSLFFRFYFIGDDDLLEILGQFINFNVIQIYLKKLFVGIYSVEFDDNVQYILVMKFLDGEVVLLFRKVKIMLEVEVCQ